MELFLSSLFFFVIGVIVGLKKPKPAKCPLCGGRVVNSKLLDDIVGDAIPHCEKCLYIINSIT